MKQQIEFIGQIGAERECERADAVANREKILAVAAQLFDERSISTVSMQEIAEKAMVGKGTLYRRFANKGALCLALLDTEFKKYQDTQIETMRIGMENGVSNILLLQQFITALILFIERYHPLLREASRERIDDLGLPHFWQFMTIRSLLHRGVANGELATNFDYNYWADLLLAPLSANNYYFLRHIRNYTLDQINEKSSQLISLLPLIDRTGGTKE